MGEKLTLASHQYALALHTTTPRLGFSLSNFAGESRTQTWELGREVSNYLHQYLLDFIAPQTLSDLGFIAVAKGPGGFTGTRIGVVTARTLGQQLGIPVYGISTLEGVAAFALAQDKIEAPFLAVTMSARRGNLFGGIYQQTSQGLQVYLPDQIYTPQTWEAQLNQLPQPYYCLSPPENLAQTTPQILTLAYRQWQEGQSPQWAEIIPFYGQAPV